MWNMGVGIPGILNRSLLQILRTISHRVGHDRRIVNAGGTIRPKQDIFDFFGGKRARDRFECFFGKSVRKKTEVIHRGNDFSIRIGNEG